MTAVEYIRLCAARADLIARVAARTAGFDALLMPTVAITIMLYVRTPKGFFPLDDTGLIYGGTQASTEISFQAMYELQRTGGKYALITMCIGGGQGIAAIIERM